MENNNSLLTSSNHNVTEGNKIQRQEHNYKQCSWCLENAIAFINEDGFILCEKCVIQQKRLYANAYLNKDRLCLSYGVINEWMVLGNEDCARDKAFLDKNGITHILICAEGCEMFYEGQYKYKVIYLDDSPDQNILKYFKDAFDFINEAAITKGKIYIHCVMGISRSASIVIGYLMYMNKLSYNEAYMHVKSKRQQISPNSGFIQQLQHFENILINVTYTDKAFDIIEEEYKEK